MNQKHQLIIGLLKLFDLFIVVLTFVLTTILIVRLDYGISPTRFLAMRTRVVNFGIFLIMLFSCHIVFQLCRMYRSRRLSKHKVEFIAILKAMTLNTASFIVFGYIFSIHMITMRFLVIFWIVSTTVMTVGRLALRYVAAYLRMQGRDLRYMLVLGTNPRALAFARRIVDDPERGYLLLGFVDDPWPGMQVPNDIGMRVVSDFAGLAEFLRRNVVDEVAIYLPFGSFYRHSSAVANLCQQHGITMRLNSDIFGLKTTHWRGEEFNGDQYIATYSGTSDLWPQAVKRMLDVSLAVSALVLLSPLLIFAAIAVKLTSRGPVFFLQERIGLNKRRFKICKFRTMVPNAEKLLPALEKQNEVMGPVFKIKDDPRITPIGKLLRRSSIDELPQLWNVLKGDMSLVGPRPLPVRDYEGFNEDWQRRRFSIKPGITCLWQVNGRSSIPFEQWMRLDLQYMDEWSVWLDLKILAKTVPAIVRGAGAA